MKDSVVSLKTNCYHCGNECDNTPVLFDEKSFCCEGCKTVFEILNQNQLCAYYNLNNHPGLKQEQSAIGNRFSYLDDDKIAEQLVNFSNSKTSNVTFQIPQMHCSSCIWLLENLHQLINGVTQSRVDFLKKQLFVSFNKAETSLRKVVELLTSVGYEPELHLDSLTGKLQNRQNKMRIYRIGVAGFCLGNIMLFSFPEYFSGGQYTEAWMKDLFSYLNLLLALPVVFFSAGEFFGSAFRSLRQKSLNIDVAIALGIGAMFLRSTFEIISQSGAGYFDSMTGLVFFTLCGRWFQDKTFDALSFEHNYKSFFPIAVEVIKAGKSIMKPVYNLKPNDMVLIRNNELIPVDGFLISPVANIDYSFVTGESQPVSVAMGSIIYAGGKQCGQSIEICISKTLDQSYLTQLWNNSTDKGRSTKFESLLSLFSKWFIVVTLFIALLSFLYWFKKDFNVAIGAFTAVLIISCPCAFTLSAPFTFGNMLRLLGKRGIYLKGISTLYKLADVSTIVFDKTGTLTIANKSDIEFNGETLSNSDINLIAAAVHQSAHPVSRQIHDYLKQLIPSGSLTNAISSFTETPGYGITAIINNVSIEIGSAEHVGFKHDTKPQSTIVFVKINHRVAGYFELKNSYRPGIKQLMQRLKNRYKLALLSGDNNSEETNLRTLMGNNSKMLFKQNPEQKLAFIKQVQANGEKVLMVGDGLNDAGALLQSDAGISITDQSNNFTPASDGIINSDHLINIDKLLSYSRNGSRIVKLSFILSLFYNIIGLYFAVSGQLEPVVAAILMPVSTVSLVLIAVGLSAFAIRIKKAG